MNISKISKIVNLYFALVKKAKKESEEDDIEFNPNPLRQEQWFLRFGDPRSVSKNVSMIHDPGVLQDEEEYFYSPEGKRLQQYEKGISAYRLTNPPNEKITFIVPIGIKTFASQLGGFLLNRLINKDIYAFKAIPTGKFGTDDEPLVEKDSINSVQHINHFEIYATEDIGKPEFLLYDLLDPWELKSHHNMGASEFFKRDVTREEIEQYFNNLKLKFKNPKQIQYLEKAREIWMKELEE